MSTKKSNRIPKEYGYQPRTDITEGHQPSEKKGYQPAGSSNSSTDKTPVGGTSAQDPKKER